MTWRMPEPPRRPMPPVPHANCASCKVIKPADSLTPVHGHGNLCWSCIELERDCA